MESQIKQFNLKPFANMLDAGCATAAAYDIPKNTPFWMVVIDGEGKIAYNASRGWHWSGAISSSTLQFGLSELPLWLLHVN